MGGKLLAIGDEEGIVTILNTSRPIPDTLSRGKANAQWLGHQNAIFGLHWFQVVTSSFDLQELSALMKLRLLLGEATGSTVHLHNPFRCSFICKNSMLRR